MTSAELRRIIGAMTERPWRNGADPSHYDAPEVTDRKTFAYHVTHDADALAISTLANHADAFVALVEACEMLERDRNSDDDSAARRATLVALADVHATKGTP